MLWSALKYYATLSAALIITNVIISSHFCLMLYLSQNVLAEVKPPSNILAFNYSTVEVHVCGSVLQSFARVKSMV